VGKGVSLEAVDLRSLPETSDAPGRDGLHDRPSPKSVPVPPLLRPLQAPDVPQGSGLQQNAPHRVPWLESARIKQLIADLDAGMRGKRGSYTITVHHDGNGAAEISVDRVGHRVRL
jgi:hypothetical protein